MSSRVDHPDDGLLKSWISALEPAERSEEIRRHVGHCSDCRQRVDELRKLSASHSMETIAFQTACAGAADAMQTIKSAEPPSPPTSRAFPVRPRSLADQSAEGPQSDYGLLKAIGEGGMGIVYRARQSSMDRFVAVKMLKAHSQTQKQIGRENQFLQEALITGDLDHPNIVPVHELGSNHDDVLFYSMKYVQGTCWRDVIDDKTEAENLEILMRVADAVAFAHSRGVIHRDIKPQNVMLGRFGEVWLMDWGLAFPTSKFEKPIFCQSVRVGGTPMYMAPEMTVAKGDITFASDVYLLGAILFQIVTGSPPHREESVLACMLAARQNKIVTTNVRSGLLSVAYRAMQTRPGDRYASVPEFQDAVRAWIKHNDCLKIANHAKRLLGQAAEKQDYEDFVRAIFGFEQACTLFPENEDFTAALADAKYAYAHCAEEKGDFDLAASLLDQQIPEQAETLQRVLQQKREQENASLQLRRQQRALQALVAVTLLLIVGGIAVAQWLRTSALHLANVNEPAMHASLSLQSGVRRSHSALRGWVALGEPEFKTDRASAWQDEIGPSLRRLQEITDRSGTPQDRKRLGDLVADLDQLSETQWWIEDVAQTPGNQPARHLMMRDLSPIEADIGLAIESLIDLHQAQTPTEDGQLTWVMLADLQMEFVNGHRNLRSFVDNGDAVSRQRWETAISTVSSTLQSAPETPTFDDRQAQIAVWLVDEFAAYRTISEEIVRIRQSEHANVAQWRLKRQAIPNSLRTHALLSDIVARHRQSTVHNSNQINRVSVIAVSIGFALAIGAVAVIIMFFIRSLAARRLAVAAGMLLLASAASAQDQQSDVSMADVYRPVAQVLGELDSIRFEMGKPKYEMDELSVFDVYPHEIYFQSLTLFRKTDQLCFELMRSRERSPDPPRAQIRPVDVLRVVEAVHQRLQALAKELKIDESAQSPQTHLTRTPKDVFLAIVQANRQLNLMLEQRFTPGDAFQQITVAVSYCSELLALFPGATRLPAAPPLESGKTPADVARRLDQCFVRIRSIAALSKADMLGIDDSKEGRYDEVDSSDVYDLASLLVSELDYLHALKGDLRRPRRVFAPGRIFPSHVYQRAGMLEAQLKELESLVKAKPDWLQPQAEKQ